jgi:hypothetical protein
MELFPHSHTTDQCYDKAAFHVRLWCFLANLSEALINHVAVWKQLYLNQCFAKARHKSSLEKPDIKLIRPNAAVKSVALLHHIRQVPGSNLGMEFDYSD